jgi:CYTH domain-containing protein
VDVYGGDLAGLCVAEVEFPTLADADGFRAPGWFGEEVTGRPGWSNAALARHGRPPDG